MRTPLDRALNSKYAFFAFTGMILSVSAFAVTQSLFAADTAQWTDDTIEAFLRTRRLSYSGLDRDARLDLVNRCQREEEAGN